MSTALKNKSARAAGREKSALHARFFGLSAYDAGVLVAERETAEYFEAVAKGRDAKAAANWVINELFGRLNKEGKDDGASPVSPIQLGAMLDLIADGTISGKIAKDLFEIVWTEGGDPRAIVEARGMKQVTDTGAIEKVGRRDHRQESGQGRRCQDQSESDRLVRRPGDEVVRRQSEPAGGQRYPETQTRPLTRKKLLARTKLFRIGSASLRAQKFWRANRRHDRA